MANRKTPIPQARAPGEYPTRRFHSGRDCGIARLALLAKKGIDNVQRAEKAEYRCAGSDKDLRKHRPFAPSRFEVKRRLKG
jgi:hypothetical protein